jgi:hypothetical protein
MRVECADSFWGEAADRDDGMSRVVDEFAGPAEKRSGWLIPLAVFVVTAALSALILAYYLGPSAPGLGAEQPAQTDSTELVVLSIGDNGFHIPANYILFASARAGGPMEEVAMMALLPDLQGYTLGAAPEFGSNAPDSNVVNIVIRKEVMTLSAEDRLERIYRPFIALAEGTPTPFDARLYTFRMDSGYRDEELYVGESPAGTVLLRCTRPAPDVPSPSCLGDIALGNGLTTTYRFKRAHLAQWQDIESGVRALAGALIDRSEAPSDASPTPNLPAGASGAIAG